MCGIFGYFFQNPLRLDSALDVLGKLETSKLEVESSPVGGHGAGLAVMREGRLEVLKTGKIDGSPVADLRKLVEERWIQQGISSSSLIMGHVRRASQEFEETIPFSEAAQPYLTECLEGTQIVSLHNGTLTNYRELVDSFSLSHRWESLPERLIDSEVFPHLLEEVLTSQPEVEKSVEVLWERIVGEGNALALLVKREGRLWLSFLYKGKARGLVIWQSEKGGIIFSSRRSPVLQYLKPLMDLWGFKETLFVPPKETRFYKKVVSWG